MQETIRLNYGIRLVLENDQPVRVVAATDESWSYAVTKVIRFRHWFGRWCAGDLELRDEKTGATRTIHFINANPLLGFRFAWDDRNKLFAA